MRKQDVEWVSLDLFGTLVHYTPAWWLIYMLRAGLFRKKDREIFWKGVLSSTTTNLDLANIIFRENNFPYEVNQLFKLYLQDEIRSIQLYPDSTEVLMYLKDQGYKIAVTSNLAFDFGQPTLSVLPIKPDAVIFSYEVGHRKPEPALFKELVRKAGVPPEYIVHIGNKLRNDYLGAREAGIKSILLERNTKAFDFKVQSISTLQMLELIL